MFLRAIIIGKIPRSPVLSIFPRCCRVLPDLRSCHSLPAKPCPAYAAPVSLLCPNSSSKMTCKQDNHLHVSSSNPQSQDPQWHCSPSSAPTPLNSPVQRHGSWSLFLLDHPRRSCEILTGRLPCCTRGQAVLAEEPPRPSRKWGGGQHGCLIGGRLQGTEWWRQEQSKAWQEVPAGTTHLRLYLHPNTTERMHSLIDSLS